MYLQKSMQHMQSQALRDQYAKQLELNQTKRKPAGQQR